MEIKQLGNVPTRNSGLVVIPKPAFLVLIQSLSPLFCCLFLLYLLPIHSCSNTCIHLFICIYPSTHPYSTPTVRACRALAQHWTCLCGQGDVLLLSGRLVQQVRARATPIDGLTAERFLSGSVQIHC